MLRALLFAALALMLVSCTHYSGKTPPKIVEGALDDEEVTARPPSADFVAMPWGEAHHKSRSGLDVDESM